MQCHLVTLFKRTRGAAAFVYLVPPGESIPGTTLELWAHEVVPAVREAIAKP
jgi:hypothetical protein